MAGLPTVVLELEGHRFEIFGLLYGRGPVWNLIKQDGAKMDNASFMALTPATQRQLAEAVQQYIERLNASRSTTPSSSYSIPADTGEPPLLQEDPQTDVAVTGVIATGVAGSLHVRRSPEQEHIAAQDGTMPAIDEEEPLAPSEHGPANEHIRPLGEAEPFEAGAIIHIRNFSISDRRLLIEQIQTLVVALTDNIDAATTGRNTTPAFDLRLQESDEFLLEARRLVEVLSSLLAALEQGLEARDIPGVSLAKEALHEFVMKMAGALGEGIGKTINWGVRVSLAWFAIHILNDMGIPVESLLTTAARNKFFTAPH